MSDQILDTPAGETGPKERPSLLTVTCILTFIGAGLMLILSLFTMKSSLFPSEEDIMERDRAIEMFQDKSQEAADAMVETYQHAKVNWLLGFFGNILTLVGAIMMWKLKKTGFYLYLFGEVVPTVISLAISGIGAMTATLGAFGMESLGYVLIGVMLLLDLVFIVLYAVNMKHMS